MWYKGDMSNADRIASQLRRTEAVLAHLAAEAHRWLGASDTWYVTLADRRSACAEAAR
jgi:hypothetical protein